MRPDPSPDPFDADLSAACPRHGQLCAYTGAEPGRCPYCHTTWARVESCSCHGCRNSPSHHLARHQRQDEDGARKAAQRAEKRGRALSARGASS